MLHTISQTVCKFHFPKMIISTFLICILVVSTAKADTYIWNGTVWSPSAPPSTINTGGDTYQIDADTVIINSVIAGNDMLTKTGVGVLILSQDNTYIGGTTINAGTLQIGNGGTIGSVEGSIVNNAILAFFRSNTGGTPYEMENPISGSGYLHFKGTGVTNQSAYTGNAAHATFNGNVVVEKGARLELTSSSTGSGSGIVVQDGASLWLENGTTYSSPISIEGIGWAEGAGHLGALRMGGGAVVTGIITLTNNARIGVRGSTTVAKVSGSIGDNGNGYYLEKTEDALLTLSGVNTYTGGTIISSGEFSVSSDDNFGAPIGGVTISAATLQITESFTSGRTFGLTHATSSTIDVAADKMFTLTADFANTNQLNKTGDGTLELEDITSFSGTTNINKGTVKIKAPLFNNVLIGDSILAIDRDNATDMYAFGPAVGNAFTGTVDLLTGTISLDDANNITVLQNSLFKVGANGIANLEENVAQTLGNITLNGGSLRILNNTTSLPMLTVGTLDAIAASEVWLPISTSKVISVPDQTVSGSLNLYDYADFTADNGSVQVVAATEVTSDATTLISLKDADGNPLGTEIVQDVKDPDDTGTLVGKATIDYAGSIKNTATEKGIYFSYDLTQLEALSGQTVTLNSTGSNSVNKMLDAKLTGAGGFKFEGDQSVKVGNANSDYSGVSEMSGLTVTMLANSAFGQTQALNFTGTGKLDMDGKSQTVGVLKGISGTEIIVGNLTVTNGGNFGGTLTGTGTTTLSGGVFTYSGTQTAGAFNQTGGTLVSPDGATLNNATFAGTVSPTGKLNIAGDLSVNSATINVNSNSGSIHAVGNVVITGILNITGADFVLGDYLIMEGASLSAADINNYTVTFSTPLSSTESYSFSIKDGNKLVLTMAPEAEPTLILIQPQGATICKGSDYTFFIEAKGTNLRYQWYKGNNPIIGSNTNKYTITNATESDYEDYYVTVAGDDNKTLFSEKAVLWVAEPLPTILSFAEFPSTTQINKSYRVSLAGYTDVTNYAWSYSKPGVVFDPSSGEANGTMATFTSEAIGTGTLSVELTHICGNRTLTGDIIVQYPTGINDINASSIRLYPNPVINELQIENEGHTIKQVIVSNTNGQLISDIKPNASACQLSASGWSKGIYLVRVTTEAGSTTYKVIKK